MTAHPANAVDWERLASYWGSEPVQLPPKVRGRPPVDPRRCFEAVRTASTLFRAGTRAGSLPDVCFYTTDGQLRAPAARLPGPDDQDLPGYLDRIEHGFNGRDWLLTVECPLLVDFTLWFEVRDLLRELWQRVGWPVLPVKVELAVGHGYPRTRNVVLPPTEAGLLWVLAGTMQARLWRDDADGSEPDIAAPALELDGEAGDLLYWPADFRVSEVLGDGCMTLRLEVTGAHRKAMAIVKNALADMAQRAPEYAEAIPPHLPYPAPAGADGSVAIAGPNPDHDTLMRRLTRAPELGRTLRCEWAARRSAAGLEPAPPPLPHSTLDYDDRIRAIAEIVRMPDGPGRVIWAVNGHILPVNGDAGDRIRTALTTGAEFGVSELCRTVGAGNRHDGVLKLLRSLHRLRAVRPVSAEPYEGWHDE